MGKEKTNRCIQIDGLRGIAILLVILSHNDILDQGGVANAIFFTISGFLFLNPFKNDYERRYLSPKNILKFYGSRALRLFPTYYIVMLFVFIFTGYKIIPKILWIPNLYFCCFYEHFWYIHALVRTCLIIPIVMMVFLFISDRVKPLQNDLVRALFFLLTGAVIRLAYMHFNPFDNRLYQFMVGMSVAYVFRYIINHKKLHKAIKDMSLMGNTLITCLFLSIILSSGDVINMLDPNKYFLVGWIFPYLTAVFAGILLLAITIYDKGFYAKVLSARPLLFLSRLSLPLYLIHFFFVPVFQKLPSVFLAFLCDLAVAIILSWPLDLLLTKAINAIFGKKKAKASIPEAT